MSSHDFEWFLQHEKAYESLDVDQIHALGRGELVEYGEPDPAVAVAVPVVEVTPVADTAPVVPAVVAEPVADAVDPSLLAAQRQAEQLQTLADTQAELIANLRAAKTADAGTGTVVAQEDVLKDFKDQYPEIAAILEPALQKFIDAGVNARVAEMRKELADAITPLKASALDTQYDSHFKIITDAVPDFETIRDSGAVEAWIKTQPSYVQQAAAQVLAGGTASEVVELFNQYKSTLAAPVTAPTKSREEIAALAAAAVAKAKGVKPVSLTDVPAGQTSIVDGDPTTVAGWSEKFSKMTPEQILRSL